MGLELCLLLSSHNTLHRLKKLINFSRLLGYVTHVYVRRVSSHIKDTADTPCVKFSRWTDQIRELQLLARVELSLGAKAPIRVFIYAS